MLESAEVGHSLDKRRYDRIVPDLRMALLDAQFDLAKAARFSTIALVGGMAGAGRSRAINRVGSWLDSRFIQTVPPAEPTAEERLRPPMWRYWRALPPKGRIAVFFDHWYREPVQDRILGRVSQGDFEKRISEINRFERMLAREDVLLLKINLHLSRAEQRARLSKLDADRESRWRITETDRLLARYYDEARRVIEETVRLTSHGHAPWNVIDASDQRYSSVAVARTVLEAVRARLDGAPPPAPPAQKPVAAKPVAANHGSRRQARPPLGTEGPGPEFVAVEKAAAGLDRKTIVSILDLGQKLAPAAYERQIEKLQARFAELVQGKKFRRHGLILAFEGCDAAGKGGTIRRIARALDISQFRIVPIAAPSDEEAARPYLWRFWRHVPRRGQVTIFDRSWYGRVLVERVEGFAAEADWRRAYGEINDFEAELSAHGLVLAKFWLQISKAEQLRRFRARQELGFKRFKITAEDWRNRKRWDDYQTAVAEMVARTSTDLVPWTLVEAEDKLFARIKVLKTICRTLEEAL
jgi:AMP-polyphosphate phosphotransferase